MLRLRLRLLDSPPVAEAGIHDPVPRAAGDQNFVALLDGCNQANDQALLAQRRACAPSQKSVRAACDALETVHEASDVAHHPVDRVLLVSVFFVDADDASASANSKVRRCASCYRKEYKRARVSGSRARMCIRSRACLSNWDGEDIRTGQLDKRERATSRECRGTKKLLVRPLLIGHPQEHGILCLEDWPFHYDFVS